MTVNLSKAPEERSGMVAGPNNLAVAQLAEPDLQGEAVMTVSTLPEGARKLPWAGLGADSVLSLIALAVAASLTSAPLGAVWAMAGGLVLFMTLSGASGRYDKNGRSTPATLRVVTWRVGVSTAVLLLLASLFLANGFLVFLPLAVSVIWQWWTAPLFEQNGYGWHCHYQLILIGESDAHADRRAELGYRQQQTHTILCRIDGNSDPGVVLRRMLLSHVVDSVRVVGFDDEVGEVIRAIGAQAGIPIIYQATSRSPVRTLTDPPFRRLSLEIKAVIDHALASFTLLLTAPVFVVAAVLVKTTSSGDVFFRHSRTGLSGRRVVIRKFRTMREGAHELQAVLRAKNQMTKTTSLFKMDNDPRVTPVGRILRSTSVDELPQVINVMRGELAFIGPRVVSARLEEYDLPQRFRLSVLPGLACVWQAERRSETDFEAWVDSDIQYLRSWNFTREFHTLLRVAWAITRRNGAR